MEWIAVIAYLVDLLATFLSQLSYVFMKKGMIKVENTGLNGTKKKTGILTKEWIAGFITMVIASLIHVAALPFCDLVVLSTNSSTGILFADILSIAYLGERFIWKYDGPAIFFLIVGSLAIVLLSNYDETTYTPDDIKALLWSQKTLVFTLILVSFTVLTVVQFVWHLKQLKRFNAHCNLWLSNELTRMLGLEEDQKAKSYA